MGLNVAQKLIDSRLVDGQMVPGTNIGIEVDQTLTQDAGSLGMLAIGAGGLDVALAMAGEPV